LVNFSHLIASSTFTFYFLPLQTRRYAVNFPVHFSRQHIKQHFVIGDKRPKRILKSGGFVLLNHEMSEPSKTVADYKTERNVDKFTARQKPDE
jgi:hypothetical protein